MWGAYELLRQHIVRSWPEDGWQHIDTTAVPVKHPSRVRRPDQWDGPADLQAGFGWDGAHHEWFYGFRLALRTDLGSRLVRTWSLVPAAVNERRVADALLTDTTTGLLLDRGFAGREWVGQHRAHGLRVLLTPSSADRRRLGSAVQRPIARRRNRIETTNGELTDRLGLARHGAKTFWGLVTRAAATILAHTLRLLILV